MAEIRETHVERDEDGRVTDTKVIVERPKKGGGFGWGMLLGMVLVAGAIVVFAFSEGSFQQAGVEADQATAQIEDTTSTAAQQTGDALQQAISGKEWAGWKLVEGRSNRRYTDEAKVADTVRQEGLDPFEHKVLGVTAMQKLLGKTRFEELLSAFIEKPQGKPTLVPESDKRPAMHTANSDFQEEN